MKAPEKSSGTSGIYTAGVATGRPLSAHVVREMARQANYQVSRSGLVYRWQGQTTDAVYAPSRWAFMVPQCSVPVRVASGTTSLRCAFRVTVPSSRRVSFGVTATPLGETVVAPAWPHYATATGTGSSQRVEFEVPCPASRDFKLSLWWRHEQDHAVDPVVASASYNSAELGTFGSGGWATPTIGRSDNGMMLDLRGVTASYNFWLNEPNASNAIQRLGYYLVVFDEGASGAAKTFAIHQLGEDEWVRELYCPGLTRASQGKRYTILQAAACTLTSACVYEVH